ncbi:MAG: alpha/beta fold hydrolase [Actinomycetota bacterium]
MAGRAARSTVPRTVVDERIRSLSKRFRKESANGLRATWELRVDGQPYTISIAEQSCTVTEGPASRPQTVVATGAETWFGIDEGLTTGPQAFLERRLTVQGNLDLAVRLQTLFRPWKRARRASDLDQVEVVADGMKLSCYLIGGGSPLVLLHGMGASKISMVPLLSDLSDGHRLIVPDLPGHGESDKPPADYSARFYARVIRHLMDELDVEQAVVAGNSMGGRIGLELALRSANRVRGLALICAAVPGLRWRYLMGFLRVLPSEFAGLPFPLRARWLERMLDNLFSRPDDIGREEIRLAARDFIRVYREPRARVAFLSSMRHVVTESKEPFWASLRRIKQPALVMVGEDDRLVPPRLGIRLAHALPNSELMLLPKTGHVPQFEARDQVVAAIREFLATLD